MLFGIDEDMNISIARGYTINIPVNVRRADSSPYTMLSGDTLTFTVRKTPDGPNAIQKVVSSPFIPIVASDTQDLPYGTYLYDLVLESQGWTETILGPKNFSVGGDDDEALDGYRKLLTTEYRTRLKLTQWLLWLVSEGLTCNSTVWEFLDAFDIDNAVGQQLDILGRIVGVGRMLSFYPSGGESPLMTDDTYRMVIKAKIVKNHWKGTLDELYEAWEVLFPGMTLQIQDLQNMTYNVAIMGKLSTLEQELITKGYIVPKPEGVRIALMTVTPVGDKVFSYDLDNNQFSGYTALWATI